MLRPAIGIPDQSWLFISSLILLRLCLKNIMNTTFFIFILRLPSCWNGIERMSNSSTKIILHLVCKLLLTKKDRERERFYSFIFALASTNTVSSRYLWVQPQILVEICQYNQSALISNQACANFLKPDTKYYILMRDSAM